MKGRYQIVAVGLALAGVAAYACFDISPEGVHFRNGPVDFGQPPSKYAWSYHSDEMPFRTGTEYETDAYWKEEQREAERVSRAKKLKAQIQSIEGLEKKARYGRALKDYEDLLQSGIGDRNALRKRIELLSILKDGDRPKGLEEYLSATSLTAPHGSLPASSAVDPILQPFVKYEEAFRIAKPEDRANALLELARSHADSPRAAAALIMVPRTLLAEGVEQKPHFREVCRKALTELLEKHPDSRYQSPALGWLGRVEFLSGNFDAAVAGYRKQMAVADSKAEMRRALESLSRCTLSFDARAYYAALRFSYSDSAYEALMSRNAIRKELEGFDPVDALNFNDRLKGDPRALAAYLQARVEMTETTSEDRVNLLRIASEGLPKTGQDRGAVLARIAQLRYLEGDYEESRKDALEARSLSPRQGDPHLLSQYLVASNAMKLGREKEAVREYERLREMKGYLWPAAQETLAYLYDKHGQLDKALDMYFALRYEFDIAYLIDAKMSIPQLQEYIRSHPKHSSRNLLTFSLAVRQLREDRYDDVQRTLSRIDKSTFAKLMARFGGYGWGEEKAHDPAQVARDLKQLTFDVQQAKGDEAKAAALYRKASYYYENRDLLLYNPPLWRGSRTFAMSYNWSTDTSRPVDEQARKKHHYEHECLSRALRICKEIVRDYPLSSVAPKAYYRAATAAERLSHMNPWWREEAVKAALMDYATMLMGTIPRKYPGHELAKPAEKYAKVFAAVAAEDRKNAMFRRQD